MLLGLLAALAAAVVFGVATVLQAIGARRVRAAEGIDPRILLLLLRQPPFVAAVALNVVGFVLHLVALRTLPLYLAQGGIAASLVVTAALAVRVFGDRLRRMEWVAVAAVCVGLALLTAGAAPPDEVGTDREASLGLFAAVAAIGALGLLAGRSRSRLAPPALGLLAGLGFGVDSLAIRLLPGLSPVQVVTAAPTYAFLASACVAFLLYSVALQRGVVAVVTAPMIVAQTVMPAVVGVLLLGDDVRPGLLPVATVGLILTTAGAAWLARFEGHVRTAAAR